MRVDWTDEALADLLDAYGFIAADNPSAAERVQD
ncbi:type II toxin-antitoxin system mRNA interferase toxin, RelE/StbE family, partial [Halomonas sp. ND22Bw]